jgi:hypothetical protein
VFQRSFVDKAKYGKVVGMVEVAKFDKWVKKYKQYVFADINWWITRKISFLTEESKKAVFKAGREKNFKLDLKYETVNPLSGINKVIIEQIVIRYYSFLAERWQGEHVFNRCYFYFNYKVMQLGRGAKGNYSRNPFFP